MFSIYTLDWFKVNFKNLLRLQKWKQIGPASKKVFKLYLYFSECMNSSNLQPIKIQVYINIYNWRRFFKTCQMSNDRKSW